MTGQLKILLHRCDNYLLGIAVLYYRGEDSMVGWPTCCVWESLGGKKLAFVQYSSTGIMLCYRSTKLFNAYASINVQGEDVVKRVEAVGSNSGATSKKVTIADSGEL